MPLAEYNVQLYFEQPYHLTCNYVRTNDVKYYYVRRFLGLYVRAVARHPRTAPSGLKTPRYDQRSPQSLASWFPNDQRGRFGGP
jgi:hypothetical protein